MHTYIGPYCALLSRSKKKNIAHLKCIQNVKVSPRCFLHRRMLGRNTEQRFEEKPEIQA